MPLVSLPCRSAWFDDERLNQKVKIAILKNKSVNCLVPRFVTALLRRRSMIPLSAASYSRKEVHIRATFMTGLFRDLVLRSAVFRTKGKTQKVGNATLKKNRKKWVRPFYLISWPSQIISRPLNLRNRPHRFCPFSLLVPKKSLPYKYFTRLEIVSTSSGLITESPPPLRRMLCTRAVDRSPPFRAAGYRMPLITTNYPIDLAKWNNILSLSHLMTYSVGKWLENRTLLFAHCALFGWFFRRYEKLCGRFPEVRRFFSSNPIWISLPSCVG